MLEDEHGEICTAEKEEAEFLKRAQRLLEEEFPEAKQHPLVKMELPRAQPCNGFVATHTLEFDSRTRTYNPIPKVPQYERGDLP